MRRALAAALLALTASPGAAQQLTTVLHITVVLVDGQGNATPVPRYALLISENPTSAVPRRIITTLEGTADVDLRPGNYTVESDRPFIFGGKAYQWARTLDVTAGRAAVLELTSSNAQVEPATSGAAAAPVAADPSGIFMRWRDSVVALWTPTTHATGALVDRRGVIVTDQRSVGSAAAVEVQLAADLKVAAVVVLADAERNVAVLRIDPAAVAAAQPLLPGCATPPPAPPADGDEIFAIGTPLRRQKNISSGAVIRVEPRAIVSEFGLAPGSAGGPAFAGDGRLLGITSTSDEADAGLREDVRVVRLGEVCAALAAAEQKIKDTPPPGGARLPVEPAPPLAMEALGAAAAGRAGSLNPYTMSSTDFDIAFITPVMIYAAEHPPARTTSRDRGRGGRPAPPEPRFVRPQMDFGSWAGYATDYPPVLMVRVTPKLVEGFWTTVARGAAQTQGVSLPPMKHVKTGFARLRAFCGDAEVTPVHPFKLETSVSEKNVMIEGLYVFDPASLGPRCPAVRFELYSEKDPARADTRVVDPRIIEQIGQDFASTAQPAK